MIDHDRAREARIKELTKLLNEAMAAKDMEEALRLQGEWKAALLARSPTQIERMEQERRARHA